MWKIKFAIAFAFLAVIAIGIQTDEDSNESDFDSELAAQTTASSGDCEDYSSDCAASVSECNNTIYKPLMCGLCKKTCNFCSASPDPCAGVTPVTPPPTTPGPDECVDVDPNCGSDVSECNQSIFRPLMCKYCRVSHLSFILKYRLFSANL